MFLLFLFVFLFPCLFSLFFSFCFSFFLTFFSFVSLSLFLFFFRFVFFHFFRVFFFSCFFFFLQKMFLFFKNKINILGFLTLGMVTGGSTRDAFTQKVALSGDLAFMFFISLLTCFHFWLCLSKKSCFFFLVFLWNIFHSEKYQSLTMDVSCVVGAPWRCGVLTTWSGKAGVGLGHRLGRG